MFRSARRQTRSSIQIFPASLQSVQNCDVPAERDAMLLKLDWNDADLKRVDDVLSSAPFKCAVIVPSPSFTSPLSLPCCCLLKSIEHITIIKHHEEESG